jgi:hypothetical protein
MNLPLFRPLPFARLLALTLLVAGAAHAIDKPRKEGSFGGGKASGAYLTRDQLRACLAQAPRLAQQDGEMLSEQAALAVVKADIARSGDAMKEKLVALERSSAEAVAAYNDEALVRDKQIDDYESRVTAFNLRVEAARVERESFGKGCQGRRYFEEDEIAIKKEKGK